MGGPRPVERSPAYIRKRRLAAVLWGGGISFGGVVSFIFADLVILPILDIYRRYYGGKIALYILATFYATMAAAGYVVELVFGRLASSRPIATSG
jgi:uncharacterized membrane protein YraQ (UPF0718 family)